MQRKGQADGVIVAVAALALVLVGLVLLSTPLPRGITGLFTAAPAQASPTPASPSPSPTPTPVPYYPQQFPAAQPSPTPYNPPIIGQQAGYGNCQQPCTTGECYYPYAYNPTPYPYYYPTPYPTPSPYGSSLNVVSRQAPVSVNVDGSFRGSISYPNGSFVVYGLSEGYHTLYVTGYSCQQTTSVYVFGAYQTTAIVCESGPIVGGQTYTGDGTYYLYPNDKVVSNANAQFLFTGVSSWNTGASNAPLGTFTITPSNGQQITAGLSVGSEYYYAGGSIRINGAVQTRWGQLMGVTVSSSGNLQPQPIGSRVLSGRVTSQATGAAIPSAAVSIAGTYDAKTYMNTRLAGADGTYSMAFVPDGTYNVTVSAAGYYTQTATYQLVTSDYYNNYQLVPVSGYTPTPTPTPNPGYYPDLAAESYETGTNLVSGSSVFFLPGQSYYYPCNGGVCRYPAYRLRVRNLGPATSPAYDISINNASVMQGGTFYFTNSTPLFSGLAGGQYADIYAYAIPQNWASTVTSASNIDWQNLIFENSEANNYASFPIPVLNYTAPASYALISYEDRYSGAYSLKTFDVDENYSLGAFQVVAAVNGTAYSFFGQAKTAFGNSQLVARLQFLNASREVLAEYAVLLAAGPWTGFWVNQTSPANTSFASVALYSSNSSIYSGFADEFHLTGPAGELLSNTGFESATVDNAQSFNPIGVTLSRWIIVRP